jgi:predicted RNA-binding Zn-ribbon protein involved in translation (DUF1610 family)
VKDVKYDKLLEMSQICRKCGGQMPKDRKGTDQICPQCLRVLQCRKMLKGIKGKIRDVVEID